MICAEAITKSYGHNPVLRGLTFSASAGEITLLVGPNGAGKSTTMKVLAGLIRPQSGSAHINKIDIVHQRIIAQRLLAYLPQSPSFHPRMTCAEILRFYARLRGVAASRYEAVLDLAGLRGIHEARDIRPGVLNRDFGGGDHGVQYIVQTQRCGLFLRPAQAGHFGGHVG